MDPYRGLRQALFRSPGTGDKAGAGINAGGQVLGNNRSADARPCQFGKDRGVGLNQAWVAECDRPSCRKRMVIYHLNVREARMSLLDRGWETVLRADEYGTEVSWLCPHHRYLSSLLPEPEHEHWCPRGTRFGNCVCSANAGSPVVGDPALFKIPWQRGIEVIRPKGDIL